LTRALRCVLGRQAEFRSLDGVGARQIAVSQVTEHRHAVRAVLLTPDEHVLLLRIRHLTGGCHFCILPGGGLEPGESVEDGLRREMREELGLTAFELGPLVWRRHHTFDWGERRISQQEQYHVVHVDRFEPLMRDEKEAKVLDCLRWWPASALGACEEPLAPLSLATIVADYLAHGAPKAPLEVERLVD